VLSTLAAMWTMGKLTKRALDRAGAVWQLTGDFGMVSSNRQMPSCRRALCVCDRRYERYAARAHP
jgi:hypothetical protein